MDAVKYVKTQDRLCRSKDSCFECPLQDKENCGCIADTIEYVEKAVQIVEEWAKDYPVKTRQSEFLKMFPNADIDCILPCELDKNLKRGHCHDDDVGCFYCKQDYWNEEVTDND